MVIMCYKNCILTVVSCLGQSVAAMVTAQYKQIITQLFCHNIQYTYIVIMTIAIH